MHGVTCSKPQAAEKLEADEDEARWNEKLAKIAKVKPKPEKPE